MVDSYDSYYPIPMYGSDLTNEGIDYAQQFYNMFMNDSGYDDSSDLFYPVESPMLDQYTKHLQDAPKRKPPTKTNRFLAALIGGATGYKQGAGAGLQASEAYLDKPYQQQLEEWKTQAPGLQQAASIEARNQQQSASLKQKQSYAKMLDKQRRLQTLSTLVREQEGNTAKAEAAKLKREEEVDKIMNVGPGGSIVHRDKNGMIVQDYTNPAKPSSEPRDRYQIKEIGSRQYLVNLDTKDMQDLGPVTEKASGKTPIKEEMYKYFIRHPEDAKFLNPANNLVDSTYEEYVKRTGDRRNSVLVRAHFDKVRKAMAAQLSSSADDDPLGLLR